MSDIKAGDRVLVTGNHPQRGKEGVVTNVVSLSLFAFGTMHKATVALDSGYTPDIPTSALTRLDDGGDAADD